jgi:hypothetical protein
VRTLDARTDDAKLGEPVATYPSAEFVVSVEPGTGAIRIFRKPASSARTSDSRSHSQQLHDINVRNAKFWEGR